jgi:hypothetical protein
MAEYVGVVGWAEAAFEGQSKGVKWASEVTFSVAMSYIETFRPFARWASTERSTGAISVLRLPGRINISFDLYTLDVSLIHY